MNRRTVTRDVLLSVVLVLAVLAAEAIRDTLTGWWAGGAVVGVGVVVAVGRRWPGVAMLVALALAVADRPALYDSVFVPLVISACYLAGARTARSRLAPATVLVGCAGALTVAVAAGDDGWTWFYLLLTALPLAVFPVLLGVSRRRYLRVARDRWEREQRLITDEARLRERSRIAQDMHDSLGHDLSLVALRAGALELDVGLDERHRGEVAQLREAAGAATERLRQIVDVLHDDTDPVPLRPAEEDVADLVGRARESGMAVTLECVGTAVETPVVVRRAAHRVVQEALTNAAKHAPGAVVTVLVTRSAEDTAVIVRNAAPPSGAQPAGSGNQRGLVGLRELARLLGGSLRARPVGHCFEVTARLPHDPHARMADDETPNDLTSVQRELRRNQVTAIALPAVVTVGLLAVLAAVLVGSYAWASLRSTLDPADFARLRVGQDRATVGQVLPAQQATERRPAPEPPRPNGATCEYYRSTGVPFRSYDVYRLCFAHDHLVSKDVLVTAPRGDTP